MLTLLELEPKQCRFPMTDDAPFFFCGEATDGRSYCPTHDKRCHTGPGKPWQGLAGMMENVEQSIIRGRSIDEVQPGLDDALASASTVFDKPMGLMGRT